ncbi:MULTISPECIES: zinc-finger domain-containing protein [Acidiphilium]|uniref:Zinc-finger domain-containing protein n=1 Tax=Acidiphilium iwatense TaxID=768198 RepID=A0ABS9E3D5_9PROT|nr:MULTISPECIES: zinc-finger domain-containing protein [Acidiphilium]MCF3948843.1 zinc-finger domain-containing protein [Acidiphilium iwatense]
MPDAPQAPIFETIQVHDRVVACDGGGEPLGHPRVFLKIEDREVKCPYCSRLYVLAAGAVSGGAH